MILQKYVENFIFHPEWQENALGFSLLKKLITTLEMNYR
jgi:hypothetical protein